MESFQKYTKDMKARTNGEIYYRGSPGRFGQANQHLSSGLWIF